MYGNQLATGTIVGTGAILRVECGFKPDNVEVFNIQDAGTLAPTLTWVNGMGQAAGFKRLKVVDNATTGNASQNLITSNGISTFDGVAPGTVLTGTMTISDGAKSITGSGTSFLTELKVGLRIKIGNQEFTVAGISSATAATVNEAAVGTKTAAIGYNMSGFQAGFLIGVDPDINQSGEAIVWMAAR